MAARLPAVPGGAHGIVPGAVGCAPVGEEGVSSCVPALARLVLGGLRGVRRAGEGPRHASGARQARHVSVLCAECACCDGWPRAAGEAAAHRAAPGSAGVSIRQSTADSRPFNLTGWSPHLLA